VEVAAPYGAPRPPFSPAPSLARYATATGLTVFTILSQYFLPQLVPALRPVYSTLLGQFLIVYGLPILAFALLVGSGPLRGWADRLGSAWSEGLQWYGSLTLLALFVIFILLAIVLSIEPSAAQRLNTPTPIVRAAAANPWFWAAISFAVGVLEETIFRGWIFGYWLLRSPGDWKLHAAWTSVLFAAVHLYYAFTYGILFVIPAVVLVLDGVAFAIAMRNSGGNLVAVSGLHGWNDSTVFIALALPALGIGLHYGIVLLGALLALALYLRKRTGERRARLVPI
jgi:membrane protease YdiL (CAAX protease family)